MKKYIFITLLFAAGLVSCEEDFLDKVPVTGISADGFFTSAGDLEIYTNGFYDYFGAGSRDLSTDDQSRHSEGDALNTKLKGDLTVATAGGWGGWGTLRDINYFLANYNNNGLAETGDPAVINHYVAFARFSRARWYMGKIKDYGMAPWIDVPLNVDDTELLMKGHDSRDFVVGKIMEDLEFAIANLAPSASLRSQITKNVALAEMSRFALYEGTFRNYHTEAGLSGGDAYLAKSVAASQQLISGGDYSIWSNGDTDTSYNEFFIQDDYSGNDEVILQIEYSYDAPRRTHGVVVYNYWGLSKNLADSYLMQDGTAFTDLADYNEKGYVEVFENRDPRMMQTFMYPGYIWPNDDVPHIVRATYGGYTQHKFMHNDEDESLWSAQTDMAAYRYAEVLLNHAEAKAELGTLTQGDIAVTINAIRGRVGMPGLVMATVNATPDAVQAEQYPNVSGANQGVILEIRRERRIEFACEGGRFGDMVRWKAGPTLAEAQVGMYVPEFGGIDVTGDGVPDIAILNSPAETGPIDGLPNASDLVKYYVSDGIIYLTDGDSGFVGMAGDLAQPKSFVEPAYYYNPIPLHHTIINPNLTQPPGW